MSFKPSTLIPIGLIIVLLVCACLLFLLSGKQAMSDTTGPVASSSQQVATSTTVIENGMTFEIVSSQAAQAQGLGGRAVIPDNYGMLFVFSQDAEYGFWMKDMLTSIDMIWLSDNGTIVAISPSVSPSTYPAVFYPPEPIRYVLETRSGFADEKGWHVGTRVPLPLPYGA